MPSPQPRPDGAVPRPSTYRSPVGFQRRDDGMIAVAGHAHPVRYAVTGTGPAGTPWRGMLAPRVETDELVEGALAILTTAGGDHGELLLTRRHDLGDATIYSFIGIGDPPRGLSGAGS